MNNKLIIFDIDGTLTNTNQVDLYFFEKAVLECLPIVSFSKKWHSYKYSTDIGFVTEIVQSTLKREPQLMEIQSIKETFIAYLESAFAMDKTQCGPIAGSQRIFQSLVELGWNIGIATGGWHQSAVLKLKTAEIPYLNIPIAHSDDHIEREEIINIAIQRAKHYYGSPAYSTVIYVGDRVWDRRAAQNVNIEFIGIGEELGNLKQKDFFHIYDYTAPNLLHYLRKYV